MPRTAKRTFSLPSEQSAYIDDKVASGAYATGSEVVRAGLRALEERDRAIEKWLREDVARAYDAMKSDPGRGLAAAAVFREVEARHAKRKARD